MEITKTKNYMTEFVTANSPRYLKMSRDVGGAKYPEPYPGQHQIVTKIRDLARGVDELGDMSIPAVFTTPQRFVDYLVGLRTIASQYNDDASSIAKNSHWTDDVTYVFEASQEIVDAVDYALSMMTEPATAPPSDLAKLTYLLDRLPAFPQSRTSYKRAIAKTLRRAQPERVNDFETPG